MTTIPATSWQAPMWTLRGPVTDLAISGTSNPYETGHLDRRLGSCAGKATGRPRNRG